MIVVLVHDQCAGFDVEFSRDWSMRPLQLWKLWNDDVGIYLSILPAGHE